jgi:nitrogen fixation protein FixH
MDGSFAVEPDYYQKALRWDEVAAQHRENARLGWTAAIDVGDDVSVFDERTLTCRLADAEGRPVEGAAVDLVAFPHARGSERASAVLAETESGVYAATLRFRRKGVWEFRLAVRRGPNVFTHRETRDVYPPGESRPWRP